MDIAYMKMAQSNLETAKRILAEDPLWKWVLLHPTTYSYLKNVIRECEGFLKAVEGPIKEKERMHEVRRF
ncbi:MAG TPA: hypothetical protein ENN25_01240 [Euryarchaeota archaeon]|nr:hypothetical protein [Euryarchaeota archaeon]